MILRLALREIKAKPAFAFSLAFTLFLGLLAYNSIDIIRYSISESLSEQAKVLLAADLAVTSRRALTAEEVKTLKEVVGEQSEIQEIWELYSMVRGKVSSRLVQVRAIESGFPIYGAIQLKNQGAVTNAFSKDLVKSNLTWVYPEVLTQFNAQEGDALQLGDIIISISDVVESDFVNSWKGLSLAPRIYVGLETLRHSGLVKPGSTVSYNYMIRLVPSDDPVELAKVLDKKLKDPGIKIYSDKKASQEIVRGMSAVSDYLGLVALVALLLAGTGVYFLFNGYVIRKKSEIAVYSCLGLNRVQSVMVYGTFLSLLGLCALIPTWVGSALLIYPVVEILKKIMPFTIVPKFPWQVLGMSLVISLFAVLISCLSVLLRIKNLKASELFQQDREFYAGNLKLRWVLGVGIIFVIWLSALYQSKSFVVSGFFIVGLVSTVFVLGGLGIFLIKSLNRITSFKFLELGLAVRALSRQVSFSFFGILALGVSFFLTMVIPQIRDGLIQEIQSPPGLKPPNLFLFDIQEEQGEQLKSVLNKSGFKLDHLSPMIRARLMEVNGVPFEKAQEVKFGVTREEELENRFRNRGFNLSYRSGLNESEEIIEGVPFSGTYNYSQGVAEISMEKFLLEQLKLKLGDVLTFDVQGVSIKGKIVNIRSVRWTSFQPNFFIIFQPGVLEDAPKTYLASVSDLKPNEIIVSQNLIVDNFPNISVLDVRRTADRITGLSKIMINVLQTMAWLCQLIGFVIIVAVIFHHGESLRKEWHLYKLLGLQSRRIIATHVLRISLISLIAGLIGACLSVVVARVLLRYAFESYATVSPLGLLSKGLLFLHIVTIGISILLFYVLNLKRTQTV